MKKNSRSQKLATLKKKEISIAKKLNSKNQTKNQRENKAKDIYFL